MKAGMNNIIKSVIGYGIFTIIITVCFNNYHFLAAYLITFGIQLLCFCYYGILNKDCFESRYFDLGGCISFLVTVVLYFILNRGSLVYMFANSMVLIWAIRLTVFLHYRLNTIGKDKRLDEFCTSRSEFFKMWLGQGIWVMTTLFSFLFVSGLYTKGRLDNQKMSMINYLGLLIWLVGLVFETVADYQKLYFKLNSKELFMSTGLWSISRHPNYFGEILIWTGLSIFCYQKTLMFYSIFLFVSPLFVYLLLSYGTGIPIAEKIAYEKLGKLLQYVEYVERTPVLVPFIGHRGFCVSNKRK